MLKTSVTIYELIDRFFLMELMTSDVSDVNFRINDENKYLCFICELIKLYETERYLIKYNILI